MATFEQLKKLREAWGAVDRNSLPPERQAQYDQIVGALDKHLGGFSAEGHPLKVPRQPGDAISKLEARGYQKPRRALDADAVREANMPQFEGEDATSGEVFKEFGRGIIEAVGAPTTPESAEGLLQFLQTDHGPLGYLGGILKADADARSAAYERVNAREHDDLYDVGQTMRDTIEMGLPIVGPMLASMGRAGDSPDPRERARGAGELTAVVGGPTAYSGAVKGATAVTRGTRKFIGESVPRGWHQRALAASGGKKAVVKALKTGKDDFALTALDEVGSIPFGKEGINKVRARMDEIYAATDAELSAPYYENITIPKEEVIAALTDAYEGPIAAALNRNASIDNLQAAIDGNLNDLFVKTGGRFTPRAINQHKQFLRDLMDEYDPDMQAFDADWSSIYQRQTDNLARLIDKYTTNPGGTSRVQQLNRVYGDLAAERDALRAAYIEGQTRAPFSVHTLFPSVAAGGGVLASGGHLATAALLGTATAAGLEGFRRLLMSPSISSRAGVVMRKFAAPPPAAGGKLFMPPAGALGADDGAQWTTTSTPYPTEAMPMGGQLWTDIHTAYTDGNMQLATQLERLYREKYNQPSGVFGQADTKALTVRDRPGFEGEIVDDAGMGPGAEAMASAQAVGNIIDALKRGDEATLQSVWSTHGERLKRLGIDEDFAAAMDQRYGAPTVTATPAPPDGLTVTPSATDNQITGRQQPLLPPAPAWWEGTPGAAGAPPDAPLPPSTSMPRDARVRRMQRRQEQDRKYAGVMPRGDDPLVAGGKRGRKPKPVAPPPEAPVPQRLDENLDAPTMATPQTPSSVLPEDVRAQRRAGEQVVLDDDVQTPAAPRAAAPPPTTTPPAPVAAASTAPATKYDALSREQLIAEIRTLNDAKEAAKQAGDTAERSRIDSQLTMATMALQQKRAATPAAAAPPPRSTTAKPGEPVREPVRRQSTEDLLAQFDDEIPEDIDSIAPAPAPTPSAASTAAPVIDSGAAYQQFKAAVTKYQAGDQSVLPEIITLWKARHDDLIAAGSISPETVAILDQHTGYTKPATPRGRRAAPPPATPSPELQQVGQTAAAETTAVDVPGRHNYQQFKELVNKYQAGDDAVLPEILNRWTRQRDELIKAGNLPSKIVATLDSNVKNIGTRAIEMWKEKQLGKGRTSAIQADSAASAAAPAEPRKPRPPKTSESASATPSGAAAPKVTDPASQATYTWKADVGQDVDGRFITARSAMGMASRKSRRDSFRRGRIKRRFFTSQGDPVYYVEVSSVEGNTRDGEFLVFERNIDRVWDKGSRAVGADEAAALQRKREAVEGTGKSRRVRRK